jgi:predicted O-methyltransferase YrrM
MSQSQWTAVDQYLTDLFVPADPVLEAALQAAEAAGLPPHNVAPNQGKFLMLLAQIHRARTILEIGTLGAYSTIWLARALAADGHLITLEAEPKHAQVAAQNIARAGLSHLVELRLGLAAESLAALVDSGAGPFDMIFIDADKPNNPVYLEWSLKLSRPGTLIVADNVVRDGTVVDAASQDRSVQSIRRFNERLAAEPGVSTTAMQTVGSKGYDGFAISLVNGR